MGCWGMGITQSDEYCEVYERFLEDYDSGMLVADISKNILEEYQQEFDENDGIIHDVYFALGKAQWMCGGISDDLFHRIRQIIESGENLTFLRELGASDKDLIIRKRKLDLFLRGLSTPRGKTRKRKLSKKQVITESVVVFPNIHIGDVFSFTCQGGFRIFAVARRSIINNQPAVFAYVFKKVFPFIPETDSLYQEFMIPIGYLYLNILPNIENYVVIGKMDVFTKFASIYNFKDIFPNWEPAAFTIAQKKDLYEEYPRSICVTLQEALNRIQEICEE